MKHIHCLFRVLISVLCFFTNASAQDVVTYFHPDASGSPTVATDEYGNVLWREDYAPYGVVLEDRALIVISENCWAALLNQINATIASCEDATWERSVEKLTRYFRWEYEGYSP